MTKIWVTGEALIDFVPNETPAGTGFVPYCGGSTYNVARAAALQGADVSFVGALSRDMFGDQLAAALIADGVDLGGTPRVDHPTTLAFVKFDGNDARYAFFNTGSATQMTDHSATVLNAEPGDILHAGSISLIDEPGGANITDYVRCSRFLTRSQGRHIVVVPRGNISHGATARPTWPICVAQLIFDHQNARCSWATWVLMGRKKNGV